MKTARVTYEESKFGKARLAYANGNLYATLMPVHPKGWAIRSGYFEDGVIYKTYADAQDAVEDAISKSLLKGVL